eukprot:TRINITY_DN26741_c0_g1_i1.p1 TRINITY_DN26741_c0_g1~~TRINITY_DN26741_c0_g1_i1.p1  ORF type:complete len:233 (-),score=52.59 TRINITY_DN26741_c0_g1_i1:548-1150(-)
MVDLRVGAIDRFLPDGEGVRLVDGTCVDCDIVIKCTGFHICDEVPRICGFEKMHSNGLIDFNMAYLAEPILDSGQFAPAPTSSSATATAESVVGGARAGASCTAAAEAEIPRELQEAARSLLAPRGNAFGSGYAGGLLASCDYIAWLLVHEGHQRQLLEALGEPKHSCVGLAASELASGAAEGVRQVLSRLSVAADVADS